MGVKLKSIFFLLVAFLMADCAQGGEIILESKDVQFFKVVEIASWPSPCLKISGLAFHSSLAVSEMTSKLESNSLTILIHLVPVKNGLSGNFSYEIAVPIEVNVVKFGDEAIIIWKRGQGPISPK